LFDAAGNLTGAVNMLADISAEQVDTLKDQARRCLRLASAITDREAATILRTMAGGYEATAEALRCSG
jgi:RNase P subunit RPR2